MTLDGSPAPVARRRSCGRPWIGPSRQQIRADRDLDGHVRLRRIAGVATQAATGWWGQQISEDRQRGTSRGMVRSPSCAATTCPSIGDRTVRPNAKNLATGPGAGSVRQSRTGAVRRRVSTARKSIARVCPTMSTLKDATTDFGHHDDDGAAFASEGRPELSVPRAPEPTFDARRRKSGSNEVIMNLGS